MARASPEEEALAKKRRDAMTAGEITPNLLFHRHPGRSAGGLRSESPGQTAPSLTVASTVGVQGARICGERERG